jgi:hypothetical protein
VKFVQKLSEKYCTACKQSIRLQNRYMLQRWKKTLLAAIKKKYSSWRTGVSYKVHTEVKLVWQYSGVATVESAMSVLQSSSILYQVIIVFPYFRNFAIFLP